MQLQTCVESDDILPGGNVKVKIYDRYIATPSYYDMYVLPSRGARAKEAYLVDNLGRHYPAIAFEGKIFSGERYDVYKDMVIPGIYTFTAIQQGATTVSFVGLGLSVKIAP